MSAGNQENDDLDYTRKIRRKIIDEQMDAKSVEARDYKLVLAALDGIDRQALTKMRIKSDEGMSNAKAQAAAALAELFMNPNMKKAGEVLDLGADSPRTIPELPLDLPVPALVDGELDAGGTAENYNSFMERTQGMGVEGDTETA